MATPEQPLQGDDVLRAITDALVALHRRYRGRKPVSARSQLMHLPDAHETALHRRGGTPHGPQRSSRSSPTTASARTSRSSYSSLPRSTSSSKGEPGPYRAAAPAGTGPIIGALALSPRLSRDRAASYSPSDGGHEAGRARPQRRVTSRVRHRPGGPQMLHPPPPPPPTVPAVSRASTTEARRGRERARRSRRRLGRLVLRRPARDRDLAGALRRDRRGRSLASGRALLTPRLATLRQRSLLAPGPDSGVGAREQVAAVG